MDRYMTKKDLKLMSRLCGTTVKPTVQMKTSRYIRPLFASKTPSDRYMKNRRKDVIWCQFRLLENPFTIRTKYIAVLKHFKYAEVRTSRKPIHNQNEAVPPEISPNYLLST